MHFDKNETFLKKHKERIIGLDIIRCIAILSVVYAHGKNLLPEKFYSLYESFNIVNIDGVTIFFILSGFLVGRILIKTIFDSSFTKKELINFWIRRWLRTIPTYLLILTGLLGYRMLIFNDFSDFDIRFFFFSQNFFPKHGAYLLKSGSIYYFPLPVMCIISCSIIKASQSLYQFLYS